MSGAVYFDVKITLRAPFLFPGQEAGHFGYDRVALRDVDGTPIIPQDQIKGLIRHGLNEMGEGDLAERLMGASSADARAGAEGSFEPAKGRMFCSDLRCQTEIKKTAADYHRVAIDDESGAARQGHLLRIEQIFDAEEKVAFKGQIAFFVPTGEPVLGAEEISKKLQIALTCKRNIGAMASIGFGEVLECEVSSGEVLTQGCALPKNPVGRFLWKFKVDRPYLVDAIRTDNGLVA